MQTQNHTSSLLNPWIVQVPYTISRLLQIIRIMCCELTGICANSYVDCTEHSYVRGSAMYVEMEGFPLRISIPSPCLKCCIAELPLRMGLIRKLTRYSRIYKAHMSPLFNGGLAIWHFKCSKAIKICDGILFDFYTGLPHNAVDLCIYIA